jgi:hypothetical protein
MCLLFARYRYRHTHLVVLGLFSHDEGGVGESCGREGCMVTVKEGEGESE